MGPGIKCLKDVEYDFGEFPQHPPEGDRCRTIQTHHASDGEPEAASLRHTSVNMNRGYAIRLLCMLFSASSTGPNAKHPTWSSLRRIQFEMARTSQPA